MNTTDEMTTTTFGAAPGHVSLTRRGRFVLLGIPVLTVVCGLLTAGLFLGISTLNQAQAASHEVSGVQAEEVTVGVGDTLWSLAAQADTEEDIHTTVERIAELNGLESSQLQPGERLYIPAE
ncbi:LysM peptidoglycan-binding domain-containing protein [Nesterenkonia alba]|uniref:LysM peptidoglycan-binding domain-containing protein n=1 Tax=Nesterenkonia alba TaxID=515814 RepID=UPI00041D3F5D|nr:LysM peptidoglycan-binding domain-containing protein [Nesterenkonia alba]